MYVPCILYSLLSRPTNAQHTYIKNTVYIVALQHVSMHLHLLQEVLHFYLLKLQNYTQVTKLFKIIIL